jgi:hypothetical protein
MDISIGWIIVIVVLVFGIIISNITLLKSSNKGFTFPDTYEKGKEETNSDSSAASKKKNDELDEDDDRSGLL